MKLKKVEKKKPVLKKTDNKVKNTIKTLKPLVEKEEAKPKYSDLHDIMDYDRVFNIIYSGVEQESYFQILYDMGIRNFLMSYHYIQNRHLSMQQTYGGLGVKFFIDSGAHTYQNDPKYADYDIEYWENHLQKYLKWVEKNKEHIFAIANFDFENVVGAEKVKEWNEKYFEQFMLRTGIPVCFVWHQNSYYDWDFYCKRYPYVGFSSVNTEGQDIDLKEYTNKLRTAEKLNALVHGFGMTRTSMLTQLPFYTADSTTWLVGLQYGEVNFWNGTKMSRLKKDKWKGSMLEQIVSLGFDKEKLLAENTEEMVRVNIHAFIEAEEFIQTRLKSRMYWLKPKSMTRTKADLENIEYPSAEWISECNTQDPEDWKDFAKSFNITTQDVGTALTQISDLTIFMNWYNEDYADIRDTTYTPELIKELHDTWINRIVATDEERVEDLRDFYTEVLLGTNDKLLVLGTNFDRLVKEREDYVTDEEYETVDVSDMEINNVMQKYLPPPKEGEAPEISDLDDEIFREHDIEPVRDDKGRFIKGQRQVLKPKKLYSNKFPKMACDTCINAQTCPEYKAGYVCAYNKMFERYNTRDMGDIIQSMQGIAEYSMVRLQRAMIAETMNGGIPDPMVSQLMNQTTQLMGNLQRMYETGSQEVLRQTKIVRADGTQEMTTQVSNPQQGGILEKIFGDLGKDTSDEEPKEREDIIEVSASEPKDEE